MRVAFCFALFLTMVYNAEGQTYKDSIAGFRKKYIAELLEDKRAPIKPHQAGNLNFYPPDKSYRVWADVRETPGSKPFVMPTHSGKQKPYVQYATLTFSLGTELYTLHVYQAIDLFKDSTYKDYLFLPFKDRTNYESTYGGGRYIDLSLKDLEGGKVLLDFNKAYNPYCAYADGFNCPIPPDENILPVEILAGEKTFTH